MRRREENSVRVTNLSEDTREDDLRVRTLAPRPICLCRCSLSCFPPAWCNLQLLAFVTQMPMA